MDQKKIITILPNFQEQEFNQLELAISVRYNLIKTLIITMRPRNETARDQLASLLRRNPGAKAANLALAANVSLPTMHRILKELDQDVVRIGNAGRTRYYLRRTLKGLKADIPVYAVDAAGKVSQTGAIKLLEPQGAWLDVAAMGWPVDAEFASGVWAHGLPYPLQDMRPQGFLGRLFAQAQAKALGVSTNPKEWSDNDVLHVLLQKGADTSGNLIIGDTALQSWLDAKAQPAQTLSPQAVARAYVRMATTIAEAGAAGSSAGGEFPKFTALRDLPASQTLSQTPHVIVKFSASDASSTVQRWSDLLVCEHLALQAMRAIPGVQSANSRILQSQGRTFLEVERFDRHGLHGRSPLCCLDTIEAAVLAKSSTDWGSAGDLLLAQGWIGPQAPEMLRAIWAFGKLIGNSDMHKGNLSFVPGPALQLAPVYDMLPMMYAPLPGGELPAGAFGPGLPAPKDRDAWLLARPAARSFWQIAANDQRISRTFRDICARNGEEVQRLSAMA